MIQRLVDSIYALGEEPSLRSIRKELDRKLGNEVEALFRQIDREENDWNLWVQSIL